MKLALSSPQVISSYCILEPSEATCRARQTVKLQLTAFYTLSLCM